MAQSPAAPAEGVRGYVVTLRRASPVPSTTGSESRALRPMSDSLKSLLDQPGGGFRQFRHALRGFAGPLSPSQVAALRAETDHVLAVEPDAPFQLAQAVAYPVIVPELPEPVISTGFRRMGMGPFLLKAFGSDVSQPGHTPITVDADIAVLDTGVDPHPDLNIFKTLSFVPKADGSDWNGHGSHVAGTAAAWDNNLGVLGVAPGARIWSLQVTSRTDAQWSNALAAFDYVVEHAGEIEVANASFGSEGSPLAPRVAIHEAVRAIVNAGVVFVNSAGNRGLDLSGLDRVFGTADDVVPGSFPEVLTVSAMDDQDGEPGEDTILWANYSLIPNPGAIVQSPGLGIDLAAPGARILSTFRAGQYAYNQGTSMAAPHVAGLAALYISLQGRKPQNAEDTYALRRALIAAAQPQSEWQTEDTQDIDENPEPLAYPSDLWISAAGDCDLTRIVGWRAVGEVFELAVQTVPGCERQVESCDALAGLADPEPTGPSQSVWQPLATGPIPGTGQIVTVVDPRPRTAARFYRLSRPGE